MHNESCLSEWESGFDVEWVEPRYSKKKVNWAGRYILKPSGEIFSDFDTMNLYFEAEKIVNNWRSSHNFPLNTFQNGLRRKAKNVADDFIVAQRIKRFPSIEHKLSRYPTMTLSQMQDIGGCRLVLPTVDNVREIVMAYQDSNVKHIIHHVDDYITEPKDSGYRGVHMVYRYRSDRKATYNTLLIEMQIRSTRQHAWATAVETVGTFVGQALKSSMGQSDWLRFFQLMGSGIAVMESCNVVPGTPSKFSELKYEVGKFVDILDIFERLETYKETLNVIEASRDKSHHYFLIELDSLKQETLVRPFRFNQSEYAAEQYAEAEKKFKDVSGSDVVLVSVDSIDQLKRAFPNYFADTGYFIENVREVIE